MAPKRQIKLQIEGLSSKEHLKSIWNGWLYKEELEKAKELSTNDSSEEECTKYLLELERRVNERYENWRIYN